jgi:CRP-like cAMP-binding protein
MNAYEPFPSGADNLLLRRLDEPMMAALHRVGTQRSLARGDVLFGSSKPFSSVFFPTSGMISVVIVMRDGARIETHTIGREGFVGGPFVRPRRQFVQNLEALCQMPSEGMSVDVDAFARFVAEDETLAAIVDQFNQLIVGQIAQSAACNRLHQLEERLARWLLHAHDRSGTAELPLTHEFLSEMLGVRRETVSLAVGKLEDSGVVGHRRGHISIEDRGGLEARSCECYSVIRSELDALIE